MKRVFYWGLLPYVYMYQQCNSVRGYRVGACSSWVNLPLVSLSLLHLGVMLSYPRRRYGRQLAGVRPTVRAVQPVEVLDGSHSTPKNITQPFSNIKIFHFAHQVYTRKILRFEILRFEN